MTGLPEDRHSFWSPATHGFVRVAVATPRLHLTNPMENAKAILDLARDAIGQGARVVLFPELSITGYSNDDLFFQRPVIEDTQSALRSIAEVSAALPGVIVVGAPVERGGRLYNAAIVIHRGAILGVVPKSYLPNYREFYEERYFASGLAVSGQEVEIAGQIAPFGTDLLFRASDMPGLTIGVEICEDLWAPIPPSSYAAMAGATLLLNLSASNITVGKADIRNSLCASHSARTVSAYLYSAAGPGESTTDLAWDGHALIFENGALLAQSARFDDDPKAVLADIDVEALLTERRKLNTWGDCADAQARPFRTIDLAIEPDFQGRRELLRAVPRFPFVNADTARRDQDCYEAYNIQVHGLITRLQATSIKKVVIGISGGLDSTHALVVCARAMDRLGLPRSNILAYTMPGFGTSQRTLDSALSLMASFGVSAEQISISEVSSLTLRDLGHPAASGAAQYDIAYENVQAGARTAYLFRLANMHNALVIGTGDLSELALGWCTYGVGDHMSHYGVNGGVPKTLIQQLIRWVADRNEFGDVVSQTLRNVLATEISPELVPATEAQPEQRTEASVGPYALQDFNLYYTVRHGFRPSKIAFLAWHAWADETKGHWPEGIAPGDKRSFALDQIVKWLRVFLWRFFQISQFKRSALPNGPKVLAGASLSPRGDWRAPSDGSAKIWLDELARNVPPSP
jgi:NAD+ synthase (glutamine-hydrolysing)